MHRRRGACGAVGDDRAGNTSAIATGTFLVDTTPPSVTPPNANLRTGVAVGTGSKPIKLNVSFSASDASGISGTQLQRRANTGSWSSVKLPTSTATSKNLKLALSTTTLRQFRARATDTQANTSDWSTADPFRGERPDLADLDP